LDPFSNDASPPVADEARNDVEKDNINRRRWNESSSLPTTNWTRTGFSDRGQLNRFIGFMFEFGIYI
jgi:hypothetical protein